MAEHPMLMSRRLALSLVAASAGLLLAACSKPAPEAAAPAPAPAPVAAPAPAPAPKALTVGTDPTYAPFEFQNEKGEIVGFDIDVMRAVAEKAGITVEFVSTPWEGAFNALAQGDRDLLISAVTITDERKQTLDFSDSYFDAHQLIAVPEKSTVTKLDDLKKRKVGVQTSTTGEEVVAKLQGKNSANIKRFESTPLALAELAAGGVDAVVADNGVIDNYVVNNPGVKFKAINDTSFAPEQYGIAVKKGNTELLQKINTALAAIKADGTYQKIHDQHFKGAAK